MEEAGGNWPGQLRANLKNPNSSKETHCQDRGSAGKGKFNQGKGKTVHGTQKYLSETAGSRDSRTAVDLQGKLEGKEFPNEENAGRVEGRNGLGRHL